MATYLTFNFAQAIFEVITEKDLRQWFYKGINKILPNQYTQEELDSLSIQDVYDLYFDNLDEFTVTQENIEIFDKLTDDDLTGYSFEYDEDDMCFVMSNKKLNHDYRIYNDGVTSNTVDVPTFLNDIYDLIKSGYYDYAFDSDMFELGNKPSDNELYMNSL